MFVRPYFRGPYGTWMTCLNLSLFFNILNSVIAHIKIAKEIVFVFVPCSSIFIEKDNVREKNN